MSASSAPNNGTLAVVQVEPIGGHRGMHYYDMQLCNALVEHGVLPTLFTSDETQIEGTPAFPIFREYRSIFGNGHALLRGLRYARALATIWRQAPSTGARVLHFHYFLVPPLDYLFVRGMKWRGFRIVITAHDVVPFDHPYTSVLSRIYALADRIIVHAQSSKQELLSRFGIPEKAVAVIPHGNYTEQIDTLPSRAEVKARLSIAEERPVILFFGQIKRVKGLDYLLKAMPAILQRQPEALLVIAGAMWKDDWSRYAEIITELGLHDHVLTRIEHIPDADVPYYFRAADVVALPYLKIYQSGVLLMALSYGRPVVVTAAGGMTEVVRQGETGYLVPPADSPALAKALSDMLGDKARAEAMGRAARQLVEQRYAWGDIACAVKNVYKVALAQGTGQPKGH